MMKSCVLRTVRVIDVKWKGPTLCAVRQTASIAEVAIATVAPRWPSRSAAQTSAG
jgi:hypothetical protein